MVSKTKTKARKKGKQTKSSKKSKPTLRKKSGIKKSNQRKTSSAASRTRKASGKPKKTTTATTVSSTIGTSAQGAKLLDEENIAASSLDEDITTPQTQEESVPEVIHPVDEDVPPSTSDEDNNSTATESM
jgi:hypothetical protein